MSGRIEWLRASFGLAACSCCLLLSSLAFGDGQELSGFEHDILEQVLVEKRLALDDAPEGKLIESVEVVVIDPFDERDPMPSFVNYLHVRSRDYIVKRELSVHANMRFDQNRVDDSVRNLRSTNKFSLVLILAARGSRDDRVRLVVIVKDIWSLRLNWSIEVVNSRLNLLLLNPSEVNLLGTHTTLGATYLLEPDRHTLGATFFQPQVGDSNIGLYLTGGAFLDRASLEGEGSYGYFQYYRPLQSRYDEWAWYTGMAWLDEVTRRYRGAQFQTIGIRDSDGNVEYIPEVFETDRLAGEYELVRSFGVTNKTELSLGVEVDRRRYRSRDLSAYSEGAQRTFERVVLPTSDTRVSPFAQVRARSSRFLRLINVETLSLQEDLRLGHDALLRVYPASVELGSSRSLLGIDWALSYSVPLQTGLFRAKAGASIVMARDNDNDVAFDASMRLFTPSLGPGRFHFDVLAVDRYRNYLNQGPYVLGGQNRLRGYEVNQFRGEKLISMNAEFRSVPLEILGVHLAAVAFYDAGDATDDYDDIRLKQSVGLGGRVLLPQFDRAVFRLDWGVPLSSQYGGLPGGVVLTFDQAFSLPGVDEPSVLDGVLPQ